MVTLIVHKQEIISYKQYKITDSCKRDGDDAHPADSAGILRDVNKCCGTHAGCKGNVEMNTHVTVVLPLLCLQSPKRICQQLLASRFPVTM